MKDVDLENALKLKIDSNKFFKHNFLRLSIMQESGAFCISRENILAICVETKARKHLWLRLEVYCFRLSYNPR